jgi:urease accessory protein
MLTFVKRVEEKVEVIDSVTLAFEYRQKSRQRVLLDSGAEAGLFLPRGTVLRGGNVLGSEGGVMIRVVSAPEPVSIATASGSILLLRACYHLGNRHVHLQVNEDSILYQQDYVLDGMMDEMGLTVVHDNLAFEPEAGAYGEYGHGHSHEH